MEFTNKAPNWENAGVEPDLDLQKEGFKAGYKPPAPYFNYLFNKLSTCINELHTKLSKVENTADKDKSVKAAVTATKDADGNIITDTYATKTEANTKDMVGLKQDRLVLITDSTEGNYNDIALLGACEQITTTGKNLFNPDITGIHKNNCTVTVDNGVFALTATGSDPYFGRHTNNGEAYTAEKGALIDVSNIDTITIKISNPNIVKNYLTRFDSEKKSLGFVEFGATGTFNVSNCDYITLRIGAAELALHSTYSLTVQIEEGSTATDYEPYTNGKISPCPSFPQDIKSVGDSGSVEVLSSNKNLIVSNQVTTTANGVTFTNNGDGTWNIKGTASSICLFPISVIELQPNVTYILSGGVNEVAQVTLRDSTGTIVYAQENGYDTEYTPKEKLTASVRLRVDAGITVEDVTVYPMVRIKGADSEFEEYTGTVATIALAEPLYGIGGVKDEISLKDGYIKRFGTYTLDGTETYTHYDNWNNPYAFHVKVELDNVYVESFFTKANMLCTHLGVSDPQSISSWDNNKIGLGGGDSIYLSIEGITTVEDLKAFITANPITIVYELAEPVVQSLTDEQYAALAALQTYELITTVYTEDIGEVAVEYFMNNGNGKAGSLLRAEIVELRKLIGDVNSVLESLIGGA